MDGFFANALPVLGGYLTAREDRRTAQVAANALDRQTSAQTAANARQPANIKAYLVMGLAALFTVAMIYKVVRA